MKFKTFTSLLLAVCLSGSIAAQPLCIPDVREQKPTGTTTPASQFNLVAYADASLEHAATYLAKVWGIEVAKQKKATNSAIFLSLGKDKKLGDEGYRLSISEKGINVVATKPQGALWAVQTLVQMRDLASSLPCGTFTDMPDYPIRGFMLDVGRKFYPIDYLYSLVNVMSYYKMNTLQLHLNDNAPKDQFNNNWDDSYAAFRLESDFFPGLTAVDGSYSKQEIRQLIRYATSMGVEIIPEIDVPAHSLAFTHFRPSLAAKKFDDAHLDLENPELIPFLDSLYAEYLGGPDPVFCCPRLHIGTDEYSNRDSAICERFRELIVHLCNEVKRYGKQPVFWGSLTHCKGVTPVPSDGVLMNLWYNGYADPIEMHRQGFHMISIASNQVYIVPAADYYYDYLNRQWLFQHWKPSLIRDKHFRHQDPLIDGGMFALWNDMVKNGISVGDSHHRTLPAMQVISEKCWNALRDSSDVAFQQWTAVADRLDDGPLANELGRKSSIELKEMKPKVIIQNSKFKTQNSKFVLPLEEGSPSPFHSFNFSPFIRQIGYPYVVSFTIEWADEEPGTVLLKSPRSTFYLSDPVKGMLGFSRDGYLFQFKYKGKAGRKETLRLEGDNAGLSLYADGRLVERLGPDVGYRTDNKHSTYKIMRTLVFPLQETGNFRSRITDFKAERR